MPPKTKATGKAKGGGGKKKKSTKAPAPPSLPPSEFDDLPLPELEAAVSQLEQQHQQVTESSSLARTEYEAVQSYYDVTRSHVHSVNLQIQHLDYQADDLEEHHLNELSIYDDKLQRLRYDHGIELDQAQTDGAAAIQECKEHHTNQRMRLLKEERIDVVRRTGELQLLQSEEIATVQKQYQQELGDERQRLEEELVRFQLKCEQEHEELKKDMDQRRARDVQVAEERGQARLDDLEWQHNEMLKEIQTYFEGKDDENRNVIRSLRDEISKLQTTAQRDEAKIAKLTEENDRFEGPLERNREEMERLAVRTKDFAKDRESLCNTKARIALTRRRIAAVREEKEDMDRKYKDLLEERENVEDETKSSRSTCKNMNTNSCISMSADVDNEE